MAHIEMMAPRKAFFPDMDCSADPMYDKDIFHAAAGPGICSCSRQRGKSWSSPLSCHWRNGNRMAARPMVGRPGPLPSSARDMPLRASPATPACKEMNTLRTSNSMHGSWAVRRCPVRCRSAQQYNDSPVGRLPGAPAQKT